MSAALRVATPEDGPALAEIYRPYVEESSASFETVAPTPEEMGGRIASVLPVYPWLVAEADGAILGYAYASQHRTRLAYRWSVDVGVYVRQGHTGGGIGRAMYGALIALLRAQGFEMAFGGVTLPNAASVALHEACGFRLVGVYRRAGWKFGEWRDVGWWGLELGGAAGDPPAEPVPFAELRRREGWNSALRG